MATEILASANEHTTGTHRGRRALALINTLTLAACGSNIGAESETTPGTAASASPQGATSVAACRPLKHAGKTASMRSDGDVVRTTSLLTVNNVNMAGHYTKGDCYDRITIRFAGNRVAEALRPGIFASYVDPPVRAKPSDKPVTVHGNKFLEINVGAAAHIESGAQAPTKVTDGTVRTIQEGVATQDFENVSTWVFGVDQERAYTLSQVMGTKQCPVFCYVVDIQSGPAGRPTA